MRQGGEPQGVQVVRQGEPTPYHCNFNRLYVKGSLKTVDVVSGCLFFAAGTRMRFTVYGRQMLQIQLGVNLCGRQAGVSQQVLHGA